MGETVPSAAIDAPRPTGSSRAMWSIAASLGAPVTDPPGKVARSSSARPTSGAQRARDGRDQVPHPGHRRLGHQRRHVDAARLAHAAEVVALEVDDHDVLGAVLGAVGDRAAAPRPGRVPLIGIVSTHRPCVRRNSSGEADTTDHPSPCKSIAHAPATGASRGSSAPRIARERRPQVLDEVDLVDVAAADRGPRGVDRGAVLGRRPGRLETPTDGRLGHLGRSAARGWMWQARLGERARLRRLRRPSPRRSVAARPIAQIEVGDHRARVGRSRRA